MMYQRCVCSTTVTIQHLGRRSMWRRNKVQKFGTVWLIDDSTDLTRYPTGTVFKLFSVYEWDFFFIKIVIFKFREPGVFIVYYIKSMIHSQQGTIAIILSAIITVIKYLCARARLWRRRPNEIFFVVPIPTPFDRFVNIWWNKQFRYISVGKR